jgi:hypothetical protein
MARARGSPRREDGGYPLGGMTAGAGAHQGLNAGPSTRPAELGAGAARDHRRGAAYLVLRAGAHGPPSGRLSASTIAAPLTP